VIVVEIDSRPHRADSSGIRTLCGVEIPREAWGTDSIDEWTARPCPRCVAAALSAELSGSRDLAASSAAAFGRARRIGARKTGKR
jgi:hypothetical protein